MRVTAPIQPWWQPRSACHCVLQPRSRLTFSCSARLGREQHLGSVRSYSAAAQQLLRRQHAQKRRPCRSGSSNGAVTCRAPVPDRTYQRPQRSSDAPTGVGSDDGSSEIAPVLGASRYSALISAAQYIAITVGAGLAAWTLHPALIEIVSDAFKLDFRDSTVTPLQNSFFAELSLLFSIFSGNTMGFLYNRQRDIVAQFYEEIRILEEVMEEAVWALGDEAMSILTQVGRYIDQEIRADINQLPPLEDGLALSVIRAEARRYKKAGANVEPLMAATQKLARSQCMRQASALQALPFVHWALLYIIAVTFLGALVLLEPGGSFSTEGRQLLFTVLCAMMTFVLLVISDLADPSDGVYSSAPAMEERIMYTNRMLERHQALPIIPEPGTGMANKETNAYLNRRPVGIAVSRDDIDGRQTGGLSSLTVRQPRLKPPPSPKSPKRPVVPDLYGSLPRVRKPNIKWSQRDAGTAE